jgi:putative integral membrane protein (TIGR02587 family)
MRMRSQSDRTGYAFAVPSGANSQRASTGGRSTITAEVLRDFGGALLFGVPLVYTMEIWWLGETSKTSTLAYMTLLGALASAAIRVSVVGRLSWLDALLAGFRCTAMSVALAFALAFVIGTLTTEDSATKMMGEAAAIGIPLALGAALGAVLFRDAGDRDGDGAGSDIETSSVARDLAASALGALFIALPIAPTGEVPTISSMTDTWRLLAAIPVCALLAYSILFASGFLQHRRGGVATSVRDALIATSTTTAIGIIVAAVLLYGFGVLDSTVPVAQVIGFIAALSIPSAIGSAAGRLAAA